MLQAVTYLILLALVVLSFRGVFKTPGIAAAMVWSMVVLESVVQQGNSFLLQNARFMNFLVGGVAAVSAVWAIMNRRYQGIPIPKQVWLYALLIGFCLVSYVWSVSPDDTAARRNSALPYIMAFGFLAPMCIFDEKQLAAAIKTTIGFGALIVLANVLSETGRRGIILDYASGKAIEANPLAAASYAAYVAIACLFSLWGKKLASPLSLVKIGIIFLCLVNMIKSGSRGQLVAFAMVSMFWLPIMNKASVKRSIVSSGLAFVVATALVIAAVYMVDALGWKGRWDFQQLMDDGQARVRASFEMVEHNYRAGPMYWIIGLGTSASFAYLGTYPHNVYFETYAEEGIVGVILLGSIIYLSLRQGFSMMRSGSLSPLARENTAILMAIYTFNLMLAAKQGSLLGSSSSVFCLALTIAWMNSRMGQTQKFLSPIPKAASFAMQQHPGVHPRHPNMGHQIRR